MFLSGGGTISPSRAYSFTLGSGLAFDFGDSTYGYLEVEAFRYFSLPILDYTPRNATSRVSHHSTKISLGVSAEFAFHILLLKPGIYYFLLTQKVEDTYIVGNYEIRDIIPLRFRGFGVQAAILYPIGNRYRVGLLFKKEWKTIPSNECGLFFRAVL
ncbi:hypothetical protein KAW18_08905 [candidate division WOR-3 bacterium]|nr:hypothetical protein [candidate division WOR-3 bacterium]MCK4527478.1 hypothetical protein [candidate division WOR-3 bacterium]